VTRALQTFLLVLQAFQVAFLWLHDWVPLGRLNDVAAVRRQDSRPHLLVVTLIQSVPFTIGLWWSVEHFGQPFSRWPLGWLWVSYGILFVGQFRAWWLPYLFKPEPARAARYRAMFERTHAFLPVRNGLVPNTAHILLHLATFTTLLTLLAVWRQD
jgi:hypothetical protein